jgi:hypothetical protein
MGDFITILPNGIIVDHILYQISKIQPWEDQLLLYLTLCLTIKTWRNLVDSSHEWATVDCIFLNFTLKNKEHWRSYT